jgi:chromosomal replication initiator protein
MVYFRDRFSGVDLLLIDDIQFLAGKERAQQAFVQVVGELLRRGKQIVAGGSRSSEEFVSLAGELDLSLDSWLVVEIGPTDFETKLAILRKKSAKASITLTEDCLQFVAVNSNDVRELDGALTSLAAYSSLMGAEINLQTAQRVLAG